VLHKWSRCNGACARFGATVNRKGKLFVPGAERRFREVHPSGSRSRQTRVFPCVPRITSYIGGTHGVRTPNSCQQANPAILTSSSHLRHTVQSSGNVGSRRRLRFFLSSSSSFPCQSSSWLQSALSCFSYPSIPLVLCIILHHGYHTYRSFTQAINIGSSSRTLWSYWTCWHHKTQAQAYNYRLWCI
jgi:hypothetical protein